MQKYELVFMLNSQVKDSERKDFLSKFEEEFKKNILQKDDIGLKETSYDVKSIRGNNRMYYVSYYMDLNNDGLDSVKKSLLYSNIIVRYQIFKMDSTQIFFEFEKLQKELQKIVDSRDNKKFGNRVSFLSHPENEKYINWKSIVILKKYLTRFGSIKPRKYTKNRVKTQKKLRKAIIRARGLGLLSFV
ncbi:MAG TPA: 30S ribosomal protein S18 [Candidatus Absconditabacterales bacterium]|nr:30S ribosomal protein S18 [Candidatus Absconditabacterales bacterium]HOQ78906.1 30S ribosomal protein S18 [Candidatus Absconditabacterales bacterium]HPK27945.1 30S ribosomal protein S18 [Candidatus Absconditabacterales bacterium]